MPGIGTFRERPSAEIGWMGTTRRSLINVVTWTSDPELGAWLQGCRLDACSQTLGDGPPSEDQLKILAKIGEHIPAAIANLGKLLADVPDDVV